MTPHPPRSTLFPYTTLFRSHRHRRLEQRRHDLASEQRLISHVVRMGDERHAGGYQLRTCRDRKSTRLNSSHITISYAVFCLKKKKKKESLYINNKYKIH